MGRIQHLITGRGRKLQALDEPDLHCYATPARSIPTEQIDMRIPYNHLDHEWITEGQDECKHWLPRVEPGRVDILLPGATVSSQKNTSNGFRNQNGKPNNSKTLAPAPFHKPFDWELDRDSFASDLTEQLLSVGVVGNEVVWRARYVELPDSNHLTYNVSESATTPRHRQSPCPVRSALRHRSDRVMSEKAYTKKTKVTFAKLSSVGVTVRENEDAEWARIMGY
ncbi:hypothetical protein BDV97DRAFT_401431 [Delphinella strobiligena]|nr:hypothetical protein BDV97DRAFT_401431 [Delphinella strobiligena]